VIVGNNDELLDGRILNDDEALRVTGTLVSAGMVIKPSDGSETTVGKVVTVNCATVRVPLSIMTSISVTTTVVIAGASRRSTPRPWERSSTSG
jgi:hypothetical protein